MNAMRLHFIRRISQQPKCNVGDKCSMERLVTADDVENFARLSGDYNPVHSMHQEKSVVHGAFLNGLVSGVIGTQLPGPGTLVVQQTLNFPNKCFVGEMVLVEVELVDLRKIITLKFQCVAGGKVVLHGQAKVVIS